MRIQLACIPLEPVDVLQGNERPGAARVLPGLDDHPARAPVSVRSQIARSGKSKMSTPGPGLGSGGGGGSGGGAGSGGGGAGWAAGDMGVGPGSSQPGIKHPNTSSTGNGIRIDPKDTQEPSPGIGPITLESCACAPLGSEQGPARRLRSRRCFRPSALSAAMRAANPPVRSPPPLPTELSPAPPTSYELQTSALLTDWRAWRTCLARSRPRKTTRDVDCSRSWSHKSGDMKPGPGFF